MTSILITGANGFIGSGLVKALSSLKYRVKAHISMQILAHNLFMKIPKFVLKILTHSQSYFQSNCAKCLIKTLVLKVR